MGYKIIWLIVINNIPYKLYDKRKITLKTCVNFIDVKMSNN